MRIKCTSTNEWINKISYYMQWNIIYWHRYTDAHHFHMDRCWKYYPELIKSPLDSSEVDKTTSKEKFSLVLNDSFPNKTQGHMMQICNFASYKVLYDQWDLCQIITSSNVRSAVGIRTVLQWFSWDSAGPQHIFISRHMGKITLTIQTYSSEYPQFLVWW